MAHFVALDLSVKETSACVVDDAGKVMCERKVPTEPDDIAVLLTSIGGDYVRVGIEAGPLSQWLVNGRSEAGRPVICVETQHIKALLQAQQINKSDRNNARGIAQMMRVGLFKPVHVKTLAAQEQRMLLTSRKLVWRKLIDIESDVRGTMHASRTSHFFTSCPPAARCASGPAPLLAKAPHQRRCGDPATRDRAGRGA